MSADRLVPTHRALTVVSQVALGVLYAIETILEPLTRLEDSEVSIASRQCSYGFVPEDSRAEMECITVLLKKEGGVRSWAKGSRFVTGDAQFLILLLPNGRVLLKEHGIPPTEYGGTVDGKSPLERCLHRVSDGLLKLAGKGE